MWPLLFFKTDFMNKYIVLIIALLSLILVSCSKNTSVDWVDIDTSTNWVKVTTENWTIEANEDWVKLSIDKWTLEMDENEATVNSWENSGSILNVSISNTWASYTDWKSTMYVTSTWASYTDWESTMDVTSTWIEVNWTEWNFKMDKNGMIFDLEWVWKVSITNTGTKIWDINTLKWLK